MKDKVFQKYRRLLLKLQVPYLIWLITVLGVFYFVKAEVKDPAYLALGQSVLYFLPITFVAWMTLIKKWWRCNTIASSGENSIPVVERNVKTLSATLQFFQILFILLLMATLVIALTLRSGFAILMVSLTIQWFVITVIHFTEYYYSTNTLRELKKEN